MAASCWTMAALKKLQQSPWMMPGEQLACFLPLSGLVLFSFFGLCQDTTEQIPTLNYVSLQVLFLETIIHGMSKNRKNKVNYTNPNNNNNNQTHDFMYFLDQEQLLLYLRWQCFPPPLFFGIYSDVQHVYDLSHVDIDDIRMGILLIYGLLVR